MINNTHCTTLYYNSISFQVESGGLWENVDDFPVETTFDDMLTYFLDINQIPSQNLLGLLARFSEDKEEKETLTVLANDEEAYETWRKDGKVKYYFFLSSYLKFIHFM